MCHPNDSAYQVSVRREAAEHGACEGAKSQRRTQAMSRMFSNRQRKHRFPTFMLTKIRKIGLRYCTTCVIALLVCVLLPSTLRRHSQFSTTDRNWVIMVTASSGFDDMFQNWVCWYQRLRLTNVTLVVVAEDMKAYEKYRTSSEWTTVKGVNMTQTTFVGPASYDTAQYHSLVSRRASYILKLLQDSKAVIYSDIDTVWLSDPRKYLEGVIDFAASVDATKHGKPFFCTGLLAFKKTSKSVKLLADWDQALKKAQLNQPVFNDIVESRHIHSIALPIEYFPSGRDYFERGIGRRAVVLHNNFLQTKESKVARFKDAGYWCS